MNPDWTIWPDPLFRKTPVSPKIHRSFPLGSGTLRPSSRDTEREEFSYSEWTEPDATGGAEGDAEAGEVAATDPTNNNSAAMTPTTHAHAMGHWRRR
jgi:hypothetical protein